MKIESNDQITIKLTVDELASPIALLSSMKEFCDEQEEVSEGKTDTSAALTVALESMEAVYAISQGGTPNIEVTDDDQTE